MNRIEFIRVVNIILIIFSSAVNSIEYFIYMPNVIVPDSIFNVPVYLSHPPAIISFIFSSNLNENQSFLLTKTLSELPLQLFNENLSRKFLNIEIKLDICNEIKQCYQNETVKNLVSKTYQIPISERTHLVELFTSKGCYKPREKLRISVFIVKINEILNVNLTTHNRIKWTNGKYFSTNTNEEDFNRKKIFFHIDLHDSNNKTVKTWKYNSENKSISIEHELPDDSADGIWKIIYYFSGQILYDYQEFNVINKEILQFDKNSKLNIKIKFNDDITIISKSIKFIVCAEYSKIRTVKGDLSGTICLKNNDEELINERPCLKFQDLFNGSTKCLLINLKTDGLDLKNMTYLQEVNRLIITVNIIDQYSKERYFHKYFGPILKNSKYKIVFLSNPFFKSMLPYYGQIQTLQHNDKPLPNASVIIQCNTVNFPHNWGHSSRHTSDKDGMIYFILSSPPNELGVITCDIEDLSFTEENYGNVKYYRASITQTLEKSRSLSAENIQLKFLDRNLFKTSEILRFEIQSNKILNDDIIILLVVNGQIIKSNYIRNSDLQKSLCENRNNELGHYICDMSTKKIKCMKEWTGTNCLIPKCDKSCNNGICVQSNHCFCKYGWTGKFCDKCVPSKSCVNGNCNEGNECICNIGWIGSNCDIEGNELRNQQKNHRKIVKKSISISNINKTEINIIFTSNITLEIPIMIAQFSILAHTVSKIPSSSKLTLEPVHKFQHLFETNNTTFSNSKSINCIYTHPDRLRKLILNNLIIINPSDIPIQTSHYDKIAYDQCVIPFSNMPNLSKLTMNSNMVSNFPLQIDNDDFLNMFQSLNLYPITTLKIVSRTCPMWKILSAINKTHIPTFESKNTPIKSNYPQNNKQNQFCGCNQECRSIYNDITDMLQLDQSNLTASICRNNSHSKAQSIFIRNQNVQIKNPFLVTISTINNLQIQEVHHQTIILFNQLKIDQEIEISIDSKNQCLNNGLPEKIIVFIKSQQSVTLIQNIQFNCSGIFQLFIKFKSNHFSQIYPSLSNQTENSFEKTETVIYHVYNGTKKYQIYNYQFCQNQKKNSSIQLKFHNDFSTVSYIKFKIKIQNSLERFLDYLKYIYQNQQVENIISLTMKIYELNLTKLLRNKKYLNQSLISIKKMIEAESKMLKNISRSLSIDYEILLINLCNEIPNNLYNIKKRFCKLLNNKLIPSKFNSEKCISLENRFDEIVLVASISLVKQSKYFQLKNQKKLSFIKSCLLNSKSNLFNKIIVNFEKNELFEEWVEKNKDSMNINQLAFTYLITKGYLQFKSIRKTMIIKILQNTANNPKQLSKINGIILLKILADNEDKFLNNSIVDKYNTNNTLVRIYSKWLKNQKLEINLPKFYSCSNINVKIEYFNEIPSNNRDYSDENIELVNKQKTSDSAELMVIFKKNIANYKSVFVFFPTGWMIEEKSIESLSNELSFCNISLRNKNDFLTVEVDFYLITPECKLKKIILNLVQYQKISNLQTSYITVKTQNNSTFYKSYSIEKYQTNVPEKSDNQNYIPLKNQYVLNDLCINYQKIEIILKEKVYSIDNKLKIFVKTENSIIYNKIVIIDWNNNFTELKINDILLWFLDNYFNELCYSGKLVRNIIKLSNDAISKSVSYCRSKESKSILNSNIFQTICKKSVFSYFVKSVNMEKGIIILKQISEPCQLNSKVNDDLEIDFIFENSINVHCNLLQSKSGSIKFNLILYSSHELKNIKRPLNFNNQYLFVNFIDV